MQKQFAYDLLPLVCMHTRRDAISALCAPKNSLNRLQLQLSPVTLFGPIGLRARCVHCVNYDNNHKL